MNKVVHCKREKFDVYIGRPSKWGNPFVLGKDGNREAVIQKYENWIKQQPELLAALPELTGKVLGCWCAPKACHGDVLVALSKIKEDWKCVDCGADADVCCENCEKPICADHSDYHTYRDVVVCEDKDACGERCEEVLARKLPLVTSGAESADIGKLDTADKSGVEIGEVNRVDKNVRNSRIANTECEPVFWLEQNQHGWGVMYADSDAASGKAAITGGGTEQAARVKCDALNGLIENERVQLRACQEALRETLAEAIANALEQSGDYDKLPDGRWQKKAAGSAETGGEKAAPPAPAAAMSVIRIPTDAKSVNNGPGKKSLRKQWRSYRRREKRAVLAQMPHREAGEWAADMLQITPLPTESKTKKFAVEFCKIAIKTYEHKEDAEAFQKELHRILRRKLRYYAAQEKRALMCKLAFKDRNPEPGATVPRHSQNQTVSSGVEGAHEGTTADKKGEPEKLNNAQGIFNCSETEAFHRAFGVPCSKCERVALAESSLSSPPQRCAACRHDRDHHSWRGKECAGSCVLCSCQGFVAASPELLPTQLDTGERE